MKDELSQSEEEGNKLSAEYARREIRRAEIKISRLLGKELSGLEKYETGYMENEE